MARQISSPAFRLESRRENARLAYERLPLPTRADELFKFTSLTDVNLGLAAARSAGTEALPAGWARLDSGEAAALCLSAGKPVFTRADADGLRSAGVTFTDLATAAAAGAVPAAAADFLAVPGRLWTDKFAALVEARAANGVLLHVPRGRRIDSVLRAGIFLPAGGADFFRSLIVLEPGAAAIFVEEAGSAADPALAGGLVDIWVGEGANLDYFSLQNYGGATDFFLRQNVSVARGGRVRFFSLNVGGRKGQQRVEAELAGEGAEFAALGAAQGAGTQHLDCIANFRHKSARTKSSLDHWSVMADEAQGVFNGLIRVEREALHTDAYQKSRALLLSRRAAVHTMPKLIIATDEVACSHGASVSRLDPDHLFYLMSRGIDEREATRIIASGFTEPVVGALPTEALRGRYHAALEGKI